MAEQQQQQHSTAAHLPIGGAYVFFVVVVAVGRGRRQARRLEHLGLLGGTLLSPAVAGNSRGAAAGIEQEAVGRRGAGEPRSHAERVKQRQQGGKKEEAVFTRSAAEGQPECKAPFHRPGRQPSATHLACWRSCSRSARCCALTAALCLRVICALLRKSDLPWLRCGAVRRAVRVQEVQECREHACRVGQEGRGRLPGSDGSHSIRCRAAPAPSPNVTPPCSALPTRAPGQLHNAVALPRQQLGIVVQAGAHGVVRQRVAKHEPAAAVCVCVGGEAVQGGGTGAEGRDRCKSGERAVQVQVQVRGRTPSTAPPPPRNSHRTPPAQSAPPPSASHRHQRTSGRRAGPPRWRTRRGAPWPSWCRSPWGA